MKRLLVIVLSVVAVITLVGCSSSNVASKVEPTSKVQSILDEKTQVTDSATTPVVTPATDSSTAMADITVPPEMLITKEPTPTENIPTRAATPSASSNPGEGDSGSESGSELGEGATGAVSQVPSEPAVDPNKDIEGPEIVITEESTTPAIDSGEVQPSITATPPQPLEVTPTVISSEDTKYGVVDEDVTPDVDLTEMSTEMIYATVNNMMMSPLEFEGKVVKMKGRYYASFYQPNNKYYFSCVIEDATACCAQGIEFIWGDGSHSYPDSYPVDGTEVVVTGTFETYTENDVKDLVYCRLSGADLKW